MKAVTIAFDVDGTLRCDCTPTCQDANENIVILFKILQTFKNVDVYIWSGGGAAYAYQFANKHGIDIKQSHCLSKVGALFQPDIAIDDQHEFNLAKINLIVREK